MNLLLPYSLKLYQFLNENNECSELALNIWINKHNSLVSMGKQPPIWIDISKKYINTPNYVIENKYTKAQQLRNSKRTFCLNQLMQLLDIKDLSIAKYKSVQSKTQIIW